MRSHCLPPTGNNSRDRVQLKRNPLLKVYIAWHNGRLLPQIKPPGHPLPAHFKVAPGISPAIQTTALFILWRLCIQACYSRPAVLFLWLLPCGGLLNPILHISVVGSKTQLGLELVEQHLWQGLPLSGPQPEEHAVDRWTAATVASEWWDVTQELQSQLAAGKEGRIQERGDSVCSPLKGSPRIPGTAIRCCRREGHNAGLADTIQLLLMHHP